MSYDPNTPEAQKGKFGEQIVAEFFEQNGYSYKLHPNAFSSGASIVDFSVKEPDKSPYFVEVKTYNIVMREGFPCYYLSAKQLRRYREYRQAYARALMIYFVDHNAGEIRALELGDLYKKQTVAGVNFPIYCEDCPPLGKSFYFWPSSQFQKIVDIPKKHLSELRQMFGKETPQGLFSDVEEDEPAVEFDMSQFDDEPVAKPDVPTAKIIDTLVAPNGAKLPLLTTYGDSRLFVAGVSVVHACGYNQKSGFSLIAKKPSHFEKIARDLKHVTIQLKIPARSGKISNCFALDDIPMFLQKFCREHHNTENKKLLAKVQLATELREWLLTEIFPKYLISTPQKTEVISAPKMPATVNVTEEKAIMENSETKTTSPNEDDFDTIGYFAERFDIDEKKIVQFLLDARQEEFEHRQEQLRVMIAEFDRRAKG